MQTLRRLVRFALVAAVPLLVATVFPAAQGGGQAAQAPPAPMINASADPLLKNFRFRSIGPASMGGRIDDIAVSESGSQHHLRRLRGRRRVQVRQQRHDVRAGVRDLRHGLDRRHRHPPDATRTSSTSAPASRTTGRRRRSATASTRRPTAARPSRNIGLKETQTIARIVIDPKTPETRLRRVARPSLRAQLRIAASTRRPTAARPGTRSSSSTTTPGFTDIAIDPSNRNILYAASYQRRRSGCCFNGGGPGSALWKTTDAGKTWTKLTERGLPPGTYGRIALDVSRSNPNVVYAQIEAGQTGTPLPARGADPAAATEATPPGAAAVPPPGGRAAGGRAWRAAGRSAGGGRRRRPRRLRLVQQRRTRTRASAAAAAAEQPREPDAAGTRSRRAAASSAPRTRASRGRSSATATRVRCTSASCASIPRTTRRSTSPACPSPSRSTAARRSRRSTRPAATANRATSISTRSGSIRRTRSTS